MAPRTSCSTTYAQPWAMEPHGQASASIGSQQGKRLACERCRGQKLKCEKSNIPDCCQRCRKADVHCSFGLALPPGRRPRANPPPGSTKPKSAAAAVAMAAPDAPNMDNDPTNVHVVQPVAYHVGRRPASSCSATAHSDPFDDDSIMDMLRTQDALATGFEPPFGDHVAAWSAALTGPASSIKAWDGPIMMDHSHHAMTTALDDFMGAEFTPAARHPPSSPSQSQFQPTSSPPCMHAPEPRAYKQLQAEKGSLAALVRRAAELCDNMYELRIKYHDGHSELDPPGQFPMHMSGEVLQAADEFLRLLRGFFLDAPSGPSTPTLGSSNPSSRMSSTSSLVAPAEQTQRVAYTADRPAALTLIASYRRLLDLYLLYYQAVYDYVRDTEPAWRRHQPIWKDLNVGGAPLREFGDLHVKLVIQAAARVLEDVEGALGLSEGCRVSRKSAHAAEGDGVLGTVVTSRFVEQCIAEGTNTGGAEQGPGIIVRIREMAASVAAVLDSPGAIERPNLHSRI